MMNLKTKVLQQVNENELSLMMMEVEVEEVVEVKIALVEFLMLYDEELLLYVND